MMDKRAFIAGAAAFLAATPALAEFGGVSAPRRHLIMRHASAPGGGDPSRFRLRDCSTQRNLDHAGRAQARAIGARLRKNGVRIDRVLSSQWCRCLDTARLLSYGAVEEAPALNSFFEARERAGRQTEDLRKLLLTLPADQTVMLVTHQVNITAFLDVWPRSGEVFAFEIDAKGLPKVIDSFLTPA
ncbi:MAG: histidine phosphatase family protein [Neomegalonema sp.]|nr:histidine phosphatase family protein [Neomegalonema sp.]